ENDSQPAAEPVAADNQEIVTQPLGPLFWPTGPITWADGVGTWPIAVWAPAPLTWLALDIPGCTTLGLGFAAMDGTLMTGFSSVAINASLMSTLTAGPRLGGLWPAFGMMPWMNGLGMVPFFGSPAYVFGLNAFPFFGTAGLAAGVGL